MAHTPKTPWLRENASRLQAYARGQGMQWQVIPLRGELVRVIDRTDPDYTHDVVLSLPDAKELFEDMTNIAALAVNA